VTCRVPHPDAPDLDDLVDDLQRFTGSDLFRRPVYSAGVDGGRDPSRFATTERLWTDALTRGVRTPSFRLVQHGTTLPPATYCRTAGVGHRRITDVIQPNRVLELHAGGATMVLQGLQLTDPALGRFANNLALALDHPVQVNAYLTPAAARGLELHFDFHDVFVVQLDGAKRWRAWEPLPRTRDPVRGTGKIPNPKLDELGVPLLDLTLTAGDCLYLPRGFPHAAETVDATSAHLTVGVLSVLRHRLLRHAVDAAVAAGELTASIPAGSLGGPWSEPVDAGSLAGHLDPADLRPWLAKEVWHRQPATRLRPRVPPQLGVDTPVMVPPGPLLWLTTRTGPGGCRVELGLGDRELDLPAEAQPFLADLLTHPDSFVAGAARGGLDGASRLVVVNRLAAEGVVVPAR
jgi:lysine-specific demethylase/histidyl-hydroxylase NO66